MGKGELKQDGAAASSAAVGEGIVPELFERCNPFTKAIDEMHPVQLAIMRGDVTAVQSAVARGFDLKTEWDLPNPQRTHQARALLTHPVTSVELAAAFGQVEMVAYLIKQGVAGPNALYWALRKGWFDMVWKLIATHKFKVFDARLGYSEREREEIQGTVLWFTIAYPPPNWNKSQRFTLVKLLSADREQFGYAMNGINAETPNTYELQFIRYWHDLTSKYKTPAEKAAAIFLHETRERPNSGFLNNTAAKLLLPKKERRSVMQGALQNPAIQSTFTVRHCKLTFDFSGMKPAAIVEKIIDDLRREYTERPEIERTGFDEPYIETRLGYLENYLRAFVFDETMSNVYTEIDTAEQENQDQAVAPYVNAHSIGCIWTTSNLKAREQEKLAHYEECLYHSAAAANTSSSATGVATSTLDEPKAASVSSSRGVVGPGFFDPDAAPASVMFRSLPRAAATSVAAAEPQPPSAAASVASSASAAQPKAVSAVSVSVDDLLGLGDEVVPEVDLISFDDPEPVPAPVVERDAALGAEFLELFGVSKAADEQETTATNGASADAGKNVKQAVPLLG